MRFVMLVFAVLAVTSTQAGIVNVEFEGFDVDGERQAIPGIVADGLRLYDPRPNGEVHLVVNGGCLVGCSASGSTSLLYEGIHPEQAALILTHPEGLPFRLLAFEAGKAFWNSPAQSAKGLLLRGHLASGGIYETTLPMNWPADGAGGVSDFGLVIMSEPSKQPMTRVAFYGIGGDGQARAGFGLDHLVIDVLGDHVTYNALNVPEPSSLLLAALLLPIVRNRRSIR